MAKADVPQKERDRIIYDMIKEGGTMTASELGEKSGYDSSTIQSSVIRLHQRGYIESIGTVRGSCKIWRVKT